ncbi:exportin-2-like [Diadema antillarum]|uniref:exportin-2-like n=1 Tax=Diadema antillarum TaxID=105358 RepID=UPI003A89CD8A
MEVNAENLKTLANCLQRTLSPQVAERKQAEKYLESVEGTPNYAILLLTLIEVESADEIIRQSAAITFKNFVKRNWRIVEDEPNKITEHDRDQIKKRIVSLMLSVPLKLQRQLSDGISIIGKEDFPDKWLTLLPELCAHFESGNFHVINGVLRTAHSLFKRYRYEFKSNKLWLEIKLVLDNFAAPLTKLFNGTMDLAEAHKDNKESTTTLYDSLTLISKIFYSLNYQDLPEYFEDNMETWMTHFLKLLTGDNVLLHSKDEDEAGPLELLKSQICDNVALYAQKYDEEFQPFLPNFVMAVWNLLTSTGAQVKFDLLISNAIQFLASVADRDHYKHLFESPDTLKSICEKVIVPNMEFRDADEELFELNPEEYIRRDIEGSDIDTRRRSACDLVKALTKFFEAPVIEIFSNYVQLMLQGYSSNPDANWKQKDAATYLVTSIASKSKTERHGTVQVSELVNIPVFYTENILPDLQSPKIDHLPVLKADALKYLMTFRNILPGEMLVGSLPFLVQLLKAESQVVHTYAASTLDKLLLVRREGNERLIKAEHLQPLMEDLLTNLFNALTVQGSEENEYIMKSIMRCLSVLQHAVVPYLPVVLAKLTEKLILVSKNPSKPHFNHYLFESLSVTIKVGCKADAAYAAQFETALFPPFEEMLVGDVQEFIPYIFQLMSMMLESRTECPPPYMALFPFLLVPVLWERPGNIPPLVRLLQAIIEKGAGGIVERDKLMGLLGVFQKLIASKTNDHHGFYLLQSLVEHMDESKLNSHIKSIFLLLFNRLTSSKTTKFVKSLLVFFSLYAVKSGASKLVEIIDSIQANMFGMVLSRLYIPEVQKTSGAIEKKIVAVGMTKILTDCPVMMTNAEYRKCWTPLLQALIGLFELEEDDNVPDDEHFIEVDDQPSYSAAYSQLANAGKAARDPFNGTIQNPKIFLAQSLQKLSAAHPGQVTAMVSSGLDPQAAQFLQTYLHAANVAL